jgi:hypothetical protein
MRDQISGKNLENRDKAIITGALLGGPGRLTKIIMCVETCFMLN